MVFGPNPHSGRAEGMSIKLWFLPCAALRMLCNALMHTCCIRPSATCFGTRSHTMAATRVCLASCKEAFLCSACEAWADSPVPRTPVIWDALKAACDEPDPEMAATILDSAGVIVSKQDLSECYDAKGAARQRPLPCTVSEQVLKLARLNEALLRAGFKYELPKYVVAPPQNLRSEIKAAVAEATAPETVTRNTASAPVAAQPEPAQPVHRYDATQMVGSGTT